MNVVGGSALDQSDASGQDTVTDLV
jgi:hypothetical protein